MYEFSLVSRGKATANHYPKIDYDNLEASFAERKLKPDGGGYKRLLADAKLIAKKQGKPFQGSTPSKRSLKVINYEKKMTPKSNQLLQILVLSPNQPLTFYELKL